MEKVKFDSVVQAVYEHAVINPDKLCLADDDREVTYKEYKEYIGKLAGYYKTLGIEKNDNVVIEATQSIELLGTELALHIIGAVFVPLERKCGSEKLIEIADTTDAKLIVSVDVIDNTERKCITYKDILENVDKYDEIPPVFPKRENVSEILFSTGTTGKEKGIICTHGNDIALAENVMDGVKMEKDNVEMIPSPFNHSHGLRRYYANMVCGATVITCTGLMNLGVFFGTLDKYGVNSMDIVPTAMSILLKLSKNKFAEYKDVLRYIQLGAAPIMENDKAKMKELLPNTHLYNFYGSTESGCICIYDFNVGNEKKNCIGKPAFNADIRIVDEDGNEIKSDEEHTGLLASFGAMNMLGYWHDEEETKKALRNGGIYSNDEAYFDEDNDIILLGRKGDVINVGGNKVTPEEIENAAKKLDYIKDCGCIGVDDALKGKVPKLFVVAEGNEELDVLKVRKDLYAYLESFKVPRYVVQINEIPRTYNGKILRKELRKL